MGIPHYFKKILNEFPEVINSKSSLSNKNINIDNLFLDFNCCIHQCSHILKSNKEYDDNITFEKDLILKVLEYIDDIFDFVNPRKIFYISIDGVPPRSKMKQQRYRRFMNQWKKNIILNSIDIDDSSNKDIIKYKEKIKKEWNSAAISPGTEFMNNLSSAINKKFKETKYKKIKSILSDSLVEGEGEFKIFKFIKNNNLYSSKDIYNVIYGLDADLIMLSLLAETNIYLLREPLFMELGYDNDNNNNNKFLYFDINNFKTNIEIFYKEYFPIDNSNIFKYYVFTCFILGNDFIPHLSFIKLNTDGLELLLSYYKKVSIETKQNILYIQDNEYFINYNFLSILFNNLSKIENNELQELSNKYMYHYTKKKYQENEINEKYFDNLISEKYLFRSGINILNKIKLGTKGWHSRYYYNLFNTNDGKDIKNISLNYLESLQFTLDYYYHQKYHKTWFYRFDYSPTILDISNYLMSLSLSPMLTSIQGDINDIPLSPLDSESQEINEEEIKRKFFKIDLEYNDYYPNIDCNILLQLLMILPSSCSDLIPKEYRNIMLDINSGFKHYYPEISDINTYMCKYLWLCTPKLPEIDIYKLNKHINNIKSSN